MDLKGRAVLVTGAAKRIGRTIALAFAARGARLLLHYHTSEREALETSDEVAKISGQDPVLICADLSDPAEFKRLFDRHAELSEVSVLINSASIFHKTPLSEITESDWRDLLWTNTVGPFFLAQKVGLSLKKRDAEGLIVNITDRAAKRPYRDYLPYCASKAALENVTRALAEELAPKVRVNSVAPGAVLFPEAYGDKEKEAVIKQVPLGRAGSPEDVAAACLFLADNDYVNGQTITVDGGRTLFH